MSSSSTTTGTGGASQHLSNQNEEEEEKAGAGGSHSLSDSNLNLPENVPKDRLEEANKVHDLLRSMEKKVRPGSVWFVISMNWIEVYQKYLYLDYASGERPLDIPDSDRVKPGPISNEDILLRPPKGTYLYEL